MRCCGMPPCVRPSVQVMCPSSECNEGLRALLYWKLATYLASTMMYPALSFLEITVPGSIKRI